MKILQLKKVIFRFLVLFFCIFLMFYLPFITNYELNDLPIIYGTFVGKKSEYSGILEVWNIDTFESGSASKTSFLESRAKEFQRENKGLYLLIRNITVNECKNMLDCGQMPDLFSCSYGVSDIIKQYITNFDNNDIDIYDNFLKAGKESEKLYGLAWCAGYYCLISTKGKLEKAKTYVDGVKLTDVCLNSTYKYNQNKKEKTSYSLTFGSSNFLMPNNSLFAYNKISIVQPNLNVDSLSFSQSQYSAYCKFISNEATILLGTQRDIFRIENRIKQGKIVDVIYQPVTNYTDLIQFMFLGKTGDFLRKKYSELFARFLVLNKSQSSLHDIGMFAVKELKNTNYNGVMLDITHENNGTCNVFNVFDSKRSFGQS